MSSVPALKQGRRAQKRCRGCNQMKSRITRVCSKNETLNNGYKEFTEEERKEFQTQAAAGHENCALQIGSLWHQGHRRVWLKFNTISHPFAHDYNQCDTHNNSLSRHIYFIHLYIYIYRERYIHMPVHVRTPNLAPHSYLCFIESLTTYSLSPLCPHCW
jgi:hypothetical protein